MLTKIVYFHTCCYWFLCMGKHFIINSVYCWRIRLGWERIKSFHNSFQYQIIYCLLLFTSIYFYTIWWTKNAKKRKLQVKLQYNLIENKITDWEVAEFLLLSPYKYILLRIIFPKSKCFISNFLIYHLFILTCFSPQFGTSISHQFPLCMFFFSLREYRESGRKVTGRYQDLCRIWDCSLLEAMIFLVRDKWLTTNNSNSKCISIFLYHFPWPTFLLGNAKRARWHLHT